MLFGLCLLNIISLIGQEGNSELRKNNPTVMKRNARGKKVPPGRPYTVTQGCGSGSGFALTPDTMTVDPKPDRESRSWILRQEIEEKLCFLAELWIQILI
jgi:hypothetical protein